MTKNLANIGETRRAIRDLREDIEKWGRIHNQLIKMKSETSTDIMIFSTFEQMVKAKTLQDTLKQHLKKMGGR